MIVRGYLIDYNYQWISTAGFLNFHFLDKYYILPYLMPLIAFIPWRYYKFDRYCTYAAWIGIASCCALLLFWNSIIESSLASMMGDEATQGDGREFRFYISFVFSVLLVAYIKQRTWKMNMLGLVSMIFINMIAARRGQSLSSAVLFVAALYMWSKYTQRSLGLMSKVIIVAVICVAAYFVLHSSLFEYLFYRGMEDNRSGVDEALVSQMSDWEMWFGKGLNGRYYYPIHVDDYLNGWRYGSETGFYNIVLKGGYLMAFTYILLLLIPAYKGMFKSRNMLCKAGGFFLLLSLLELYPFGWLEFSPKFLAIWMMVSLCTSPEVRCMNDAEIKQQFF